MTTLAKLSTINGTNNMKVDSFKQLKARNIWRNVDAVCFDVDSTVCRDEAIDELAKFAGKDKEVAEL